MRYWSLRGSMACFLFKLALLSSLAQTTTKIVDHGPDGEKLVFAVLGDGYTTAEQQKFDSDVDNLLIKGVFSHDFYKANFNAFNVYRIDLVSQQSGVSSPTFVKNTALKVIYNGKWAKCWLEESADTDSLITDSINIGKAPDFVIIVANEANYGGCRRGNRLYVTSGDPWDVVAHEYGHAVAGLYDEYSVSGQGHYNGPAINVLNCSTVLDGKNVVWSKFIDGRTTLPTDGIRNLDPNRTVGEFKGCNYAETGIYRPVQECRMNSNTPEFCPVCLAELERRVKPYLSASPAESRSSSVPSTNGASPQGAPPPGGRRGELAEAAVTKFVSMTVRIDANLGVVVEKASEVTGRLAVAPAQSPAFIATLTKGDRSSLADLLVDDPFVVRGFSDPEQRRQGEFISHVSASTIVVNVPNSTMASVSQGVGMQLYSVKTGTKVSLPPLAPASHINLNTLIQKGELRKVIEVSSKSFGDQMRQANIK